MICCRDYGAIDSTGPAVTKPAGRVRLLIAPLSGLNTDLGLDLARLCASQFGNKHVSYGLWLSLLNASLACSRLAFYVQQCDAPVDLVESMLSAIEE